MEFKAVLVEKSNNVVVNGTKFMVSTFVEMNNALPTANSRKWYLLDNADNKIIFDKLVIGQLYNIQLNFLGKISSVVK